MIPESGAEYPYLLRSFGPLVGYLCCWINVFVIRPASVGIISKAFASYAVEPFFAGDGDRDEETIEMVKKGVTAATLSTAVKLSPMILDYKVIDQQLCCAW